MVRITGIHPAFHHGTRRCSGLLEYYGTRIGLACRVEDFRRLVNGHERIASPPSDNYLSALTRGILLRFSDCRQWIPPLRLRTVPFGVWAMPPMSRRKLATLSRCVTHEQVCDAKVAMSNDQSVHKHVNLLSASSFVRSSFVYCLQLLEYSTLAGTWP